MYRFWKRRNRSRFILPSEKGMRTAGVGAKWCGARPTCWSVRMGCEIFAADEKWQGYAFFGSLWIFRYSFQFRVRILYIGKI